MKEKTTKAQEEGCIQSPGAKYHHSPYPPIVNETKPHPFGNEGKSLFDNQTPSAITNKLYITKIP